MQKPCHAARFYKKCAIFAVVITLIYFVMETAQIIDLVSSLGFPIVMCAALFYYMVNQRKAHSTELDNLRTTLEENTKVLTELSTLIKLIANEKER